MQYRKLLAVWKTGEFDTIVTRFSGLIPLLREYWFDEPEKVRDWAGKLRSAIR